MLRAEERNWIFHVCL